MPQSPSSMPFSRLSASGSSTNVELGLRITQDFDFGRAGLDPYTPKIFCLGQVAVAAHWACPRNRQRPVREALADPKRLGSGTILRHLSIAVSIFASRTPWHSPRVSRSAQAVSPAEKPSRERAKPP